MGLFVSFYRKNEFEPIQGVVDVLVSAPSTLRTNTGIGIGDSIEEIVAITILSMGIRFTIQVIIKIFGLMELISSV